MYIYFLIAQFSYVHFRPVLPCRFHTFRKTVIYKVNTKQSVQATIHVACVCITGNVHKSATIIQAKHHLGQISILPYGNWISKSYVPLHWLSDWLLSMLCAAKMQWRSWFYDRTVRCTLQRQLSSHVSSSSSCCRSRCNKDCIHHLTIALRLSLLWKIQ